MTDPTADGRDAVREQAARTRQAAARQLDGRRRTWTRAGPCSSAANIPTFPYPDTAARIFTHMWRYSDNLRGLYETPAVASDPTTTPRRGRPAIIAGAQSAGRTVLTELESKQVLAAYGIPTVGDPSSRRDRGRGRRAADAIGYPVVLKLHSETITHKTDVGGVALNLGDGRAVREAYRRDSGRRHRAKAGPQHFLGVTVQPMVPAGGYEVIVGSSLDPQFGPVLLFGSGGKLVEVYRDRALALPPLNTTLARRMMEQTKVFVALQGVRGAAPADLAAPRAPARPVQRARRRATAHQGNRHQSVAGLAGPAARARRAHRVAPGRGRPTMRSADRRRSDRIPFST